MLAGQGPGHDESPWMAATSVAMTGVISGSVLAGTHFARRARAEGLAQAGYAKPAVDADAFDVVGTRG
jgi:hypothetical protein